MSKSGFVGISEVNADVDATAIAIMRLHLRAFGATAYIPSPAHGGYWWTATDEMTSVMVAFASLQPSRTEAGAGYLERAGVHPYCRGLGLHRRLIGVREAKARRLGFHALLVDTTNNPVAQRNLELRGYRRFTPSHPWSLLPETIYWRKDL